MKVAFKTSGSIHCCQLGIPSCFVHHLASHDEASALLPIYSAPNFFDNSIRTGQDKWNGEDVMPLNFAKLHRVVCWLLDALELTGNHFAIRWSVLQPLVSYQTSTELGPMTNISDDCKIKGRSIFRVTELPSE
jgi:hypothetical protein